MDNISVNAMLLKYEGEIKKIAYRYWRFFSGKKNESYFDLDDLISGGMEAVWQVCERRPNKVENEAYIKGAVTYGILGRIDKLCHKGPPEIHLVRHHGEEVPLVDLLPAYDDHEERLESLDEIYYHIKEEFSEKDAKSLMRLVESCDDVFDLDLSKPPPTELKEKIKIVTTMDLSDEEMVVYANVLMCSTKKFPRDYVVGQKERARKYIRFFLQYLEISPDEFASLYCDRKNMLRRFRLLSFYQKVYHQNFQELFSDVFPDIEAYRIRSNNMWKGRGGLVNAYNRIDLLGKETGKKPSELIDSDFRKNGLSGILKQVFNGSHRKAVEFRWPGTYPEYSKEVEKLWVSL